MSTIAKTKDGQTRPKEASVVLQVAVDQRAECRCRGEVEDRRGGGGERLEGMRWG